jgi:hypothetical protein
MHSPIYIYHARTYILVLVLNTVNLDLVLHEHITLEHLLQPKKMHTAVLVAHLGFQKQNTTVQVASSERALVRELLHGCLLTSVAGSSAQLWPRSRIATY